MGLPEGQSPEHHLTVEENSAGGSNTTPLKALANSVRMRKWCSTTCPFSFGCPMLPLSMSKDREVIVKGVRKHPCTLKEAPPGIQRRIQNMFLNGEEGLLNEIRNALFVASQGLGGDVRERLAFADSLGKLHDRIYGVRNNMGQVEPFKITVAQYHSEGKTAQQMKIERQERAAVLVGQAPIPEESDPESLYGSPSLQAIVHREEEDDDSDVS